MWPKRARPALAPAVGVAVVLGVVLIARTGIHVSPGANVPVPPPGVPDPVRPAEVGSILGPDAIPAIDNPVFIPTAKAGSVPVSTPVIGIELNGAAHVYPIPMLSRHEIVNDTLGGHPIAVTWVTTLLHVHRVCPPGRQPDAPLRRFGQADPQLARRVRP
jgi:Protein of unknown function (DUF3179)